MTYTHLIAFEGRSVTLGRQMAIVLMIAVLIAGCVILALKRKSRGNETSPKQPANATTTATVTVPIQIKVSFGHSDEEESDPAEIDPAAKPTGEGRWYVYAHRDSAGRVFYIGKGCEGRADSNDRHYVWHKYVAERSGGQFRSQILSHHATSEEAEERESRLISRYGKHLVNWINPRRAFDYAALDRFHKLRQANRAFVAETRPLDETSPDIAIDRYRQALRNVLEFRNIVLERGLVAELNTGHVAGNGELEILDRLTLCLKRLDRMEELRAAVTEFEALHPTAVEGSAKFERIRKRGNPVVSRAARTPNKTQPT
jgi:hypothetical protein